MKSKIYNLILLCIVGCLSRVGKAAVTASGCGVTKGCYRSPASCSDGTDCAFFVSWNTKQDGSNVFTITGTASSTYIALGFSNSQSMADTDVYACTSNNEMVRSRNSNGRVNDKSPVLKGVTDQSITMLNGRIECTFTRQATLNDGDNTYYDLSAGNSYYVIMSKSNTGDLQADGNIAVHDDRIAGTLTAFDGYPLTPDMPPSMTTVPPNGMPMTNPLSTPTITSEGCGTTKGCLRTPVSCTDGTNCEFFVSWVADQSGAVTFSMTGTNTGTYIALGFSKSGSMSDSDVYACTSNSQIVRSRNPSGRTNQPSTLKGVSSETVSMVDGRIECHFTRQASLSDGDTTFYDLSGSNTYYIIMAKHGGPGGLQQDGVNIAQHSARFPDTVMTSFQDIVQMPPAMTDPPAMPTTPKDPMTPPPDYVPITSEGCGTTKGCFRSPDTCTGGTACDFFASWVADQSGNIMFEITGNASGTYIALGFSTSSSMDNSEVYACTSNNEMVRSYNFGYKINDPSPLLIGVSNPSITQINGRIECSFSRAASLNDGDSMFTDLSGSNTYYVIMSKSNTGDLLQDGNIDRHDDRIAGTNLISFQDIVQTPVTEMPTTSSEPGPTMTQASPVPTKVSSVGCGSTKGCFRRPQDCTGVSDCEFFVSWTSNEADGNNVFTLTGTGAGSYIALGFSKSGLMADSDVYACTSNMEVVRSRNTELNNNDPSLPLAGVSDISVSMINGQIECQFTRQTSMSVGRRRRRQADDETYYDLSADNTYYVIMAKSSSNGVLPDGNIVYHTDRVNSPQPTSFIVDPSATQGPPRTTKPVTDPASRNPITSEGCGVTKGCFRQPSQCKGASDCEYFASWTSDKTGLHQFTLTGNGAGSYISLGFSKSGFMRNSDVYACTSNREVVRSRNTDGNTNDPRPELKGVNNIAVAIVNGQIECQFARQPSLDDGDDTYYDLSGNNSYYIIMAKSSSNGLGPDGDILRHTDRTIGSSQSFSEFSEATAVANNKLLLQKFHGCLMVIAWLGLASIGITMARYYKPIAPGVNYCKKPVWFSVHRFVMILAFLLTVGAFVVIFIAAEGFIEKQPDVEVDTRYIHAIIGTFVTFLAIMNPIMAFFRCHPGTPKRPIFDWGHWAVGTSAHILGIVAICLAVAGIGNATPIINGLPSYLLWLVIVFIVLHIALWLFLECKKCLQSEDAKKGQDVAMTTPSNDQVNGDPNSSQQQPASSPPNKSTKGVMNMALLLYIIIVVVIAAIMIITIVVAT